jgi:hypothetical protein
VGLAAADGGSEGGAWAVVDTGGPIWHDEFSSVGVRRQSTRKGKNGRVAHPTAPGQPVHFDLP